MYGALIAGVSALAIALILFFGPVVAAVTVLSAAGVALIAMRPSWSIYAAIAVGLTAFPAVIPYSVQFGPTTVFLFEPFLVIAAIWALLTHPNPKVAHFRIAGMALLLVFGTLVGVAAQHPPLEIIGDGRGLLTTVLAALVATRIYGTRYAHSSMLILRVSLWVSLAVTVAASILKFPVAGRSEAAALFLSSSGAGSSDSTRYLTSASQLAVLVASISVALVLANRVALKQALPYLLPSTALSFLSFSRNSFLAILIAAIFAIIASRAMRSLAVILRLTVIVGFPFLLFVLAHASIGLPGGDYVLAQTNAFSTRVLGGLEASTLADDTSAIARVNEDNFMMAAIAQSPITGHGFGFAYRPAIGPPGSFSATKGQYYGHNFYLWMMVKTGVIGLVAFLYFAFSPVLKALKRPDNSALLGLASANLGLLAAIIFAPFPNDVGNGGSLAVGLLFGLLIAAAKSNRWDPALPMAQEPASLAPAHSSFAVKGPFQTVHPEQSGVTPSSKTLEL